MTLVRSIAGWAFVIGLPLAWSPMAGADVATCKRALSRAQAKYMIGVSKVKAKETDAKTPGGRAVTPEETAARLARELQKARNLIEAGCSGVAKPSDADPRLCPGLSGPTAFEDCLNGYSNSVEALVDSLEEELLPNGPICLADPKCGTRGLPACDPQKECFCHATAEGGVHCINFFSCETAQPCNSSSECPPDHACYVNTCCGASGLCGPTLCQAGGGGGSAEGLRSSIPE
jgi:hypothetical protein